MNKCNIFPLCVFVCNTSKDSNPFIHVREKQCKNKSTHRLAGGHGNPEAQLSIRFTRAVLLCAKRVSSLIHKS